MKKLIFITSCLALLLVSACNVHEWPQPPGIVALKVNLNFESDITKWHHNYVESTITEVGRGETYDGRVLSGYMRYIIRAYPVLDRQRAVQDYTHEFVYNAEISGSYDRSFVIELPEGNYTLMVWADIVPTFGVAHYYNAANFSEIELQGDHQGTTNYRDAFRGSRAVSLVSDIVDREPAIYDIAMQRPLAKYEFITTDLKEFIDKEIEYLQKQAATRGEEIPTRIDTDNYNVVFYYTGYMPCAYNLSIDKPVDSKLGVKFVSKLDVLSESEASLGFDYVFVNGSTSLVTVQIGLYDENDRQLALSDPINLPLSRNLHTILKGSFLMQQASGGIRIDPNFDGDHNIVIE